jgi:predicted ATPase
MERKAIDHNIHEEILQLLLSEYSNDQSFTFSLRKTNRSNRLKKGFWFYGNEKYLAISFWTGYDWRNKTPNIIFVINDYGETTLQLTASDSENKQTLFRNELYERIGSMYPDNHKYYKKYNEFGSDYMRSLKNFILKDKKIIDKVIDTWSDVIFDIDDIGNSKIERIDKDVFQKNFQRVNSYKHNAFRDVRPKLPQTIKSFSISNYGPITKKIEINDLPDNVQWIFLTGLNGTGKSSILQGLTALRCCNYNPELTERKKLITDENFIGELIIQKIGDDKDIYQIEKSEPIIKDPHFELNGFAAYGASRLSINNRIKNGLKQDIDPERTSLTYSIFNINGVLLDLDEELKKWLKNIDGAINANKHTGLFNGVVDLLVAIIPNLSKIIKTPDNFHTLYVEIDNNEKLYKKVPYEALATGMKSLVAMIGDLIIRLLKQQPEVEDLSELQGIVLIDEIDVHLHPHLQKVLVEQLSEALPDVQFVATTHSPIPILGSTDKSVIIKVDRNGNDGTNITRLNELEDSIKNFSPNIIYTSSIFDLDDLTSKQNESFDDISTVDSIDEFLLEDRLKKQLNIMKSNEDDLISLY